jgi:6-phosphogluconolactonase (cycloisomerase 2 family)
VIDVEGTKMNNVKARDWMLAVSLGLMTAACGGGSGGKGGSGGGGGGGVGAPSDLSYDIPIATYLIEVPIGPNAPSVSGEVTSFSVTPPLPDGLVLDPASGVVSGVPIARTNQAIYIVTASGPGGTTDVGLDITVSEPPAFVYITHDDDTVSLFSVDAFDGELRHHGFEFAPEFEHGGKQVVTHPSGRFLWVGNADDVFSTNDISFYSIEHATGRLTPGSAVEGFTGAHKLVISDDGSRAYVIAHDAHLIRSYDIDLETGEMTPFGPTQETGTSPSAITLDPLGRFVFVVNYHSTNVYTFPIDPVTGELGPNIPGVTFFSRIPRDLAVDSNGRYLYITFEVTNEVQKFAIHDNGTLGFGPHYSTGVKPSSIVVHPTGRFAYVANTGSDTVTQYRVDLSDGDLVSLGTVPAGDMPVQIALDASGSYAYVVNKASNDVTVYSVDLSTGRLIQGRNIRTRANPTSIALRKSPKPTQPVARFLYALNKESQDVSQFDIDPVSGLLTEFPGSTGVGVSPDDIALDPLGRFAYVANRTDQTVSIILMSAATGELTQSAVPYTLPGPPGGLAADPSGRYLFVSVDNVDQLHAYEIHQLTGTLTLVDTAFSGAVPGGVSVDPTGRFVYVSSSLSITGYEVDRGVFSPAPTSAQAPGDPGQLRFAPRGDRAYVALRSASLVVPYDIDSATGMLVVNAVGSVPTDFRPSVVDVHPSGQYAYAAVPGSTVQQGYVALLELDAFGSLSEVARYVEGLGPKDLRISPQGRFLYVANRDGDNVTVFGVDALGGTLQVLETVQAGLEPSALIYHAILE